MLLLTREQLHLNFIQVGYPCILRGPGKGGTKSKIKTYARGHHDARRGPSISKYRSLVRPNAQIVALRAQYA